MSEENNAPILEPENAPIPEPENTPIPEPKSEQANTYQTIIEQQQAQINALLEQTTALNNQIINMVNSGAQFNDNLQSAQSAKLVQTPSPISLSEDMDYSLESLAKDIGRK